jgi:hypothetical protein
MIAKRRNKDWERVRRLIDIQECLTLDLDEMVTVVMTDLHEEPYTLDEVYTVHVFLAFFLTFFSWIAVPSSVRATSTRISRSDILTQEDLNAVSITKTIIRSSKRVISGFSQQNFVNYR